MTTMTEAQRQWLLQRFIDHDGLQAAADSGYDKMLQSIEKTGAITHYDAMFGNNYYALTTAGRAALFTTNLSASEREANLKAAFAENDIPWPSLTTTEREAQK